MLLLLLFATSATHCAAQPYYQEFESRGLGQVFQRTQFEAVISIDSSAAQIEFSEVDKDESYAYTVKGSIARDSDGAITVLAVDSCQTFTSTDCPKLEGVTGELRRKRLILHTICIMIDG